MENNDQPPSPDQNKFIGKTKSFNTASAFKRNEPSKRKSFDLNEAVQSLDLALCRLKKSKLVNGEYPTGQQTIQSSQEATDMLMDMCASSNMLPGTDTSMMSIDFSHYELMRDLSRANCNSDFAVSDNTCSTHLSPAELNIKDEHLEKYFRSMEVYAKSHRSGGHSSMDIELPNNK